MSLSVILELFSICTEWVITANVYVNVPHTFNLGTFRAILSNHLRIIPEDSPGPSPGGPVHHPQKWLLGERACVPIDLIGREKSTGTASFDFSLFLGVHTQPSTG